VFGRCLVARCDNSTCVVDRDRETSWTWKDANGWLKFMLPRFVLLTMEIDGALTFSREAS
jgi:hypothetical protein